MQSKYQDKVSAALKKLNAAEAVRAAQRYDSAPVVWSAVLHEPEGGVAYWGLYKSEVSYARYRRKTHERDVGSGLLLIDMLEHKTRYAQEQIANFYIRASDETESEMSGD